MNFSYVKVIVYVLCLCRKDKFGPVIFNITFDESGWASQPVANSLRWIVNNNINIIDALFAILLLNVVGLSLKELPAYSNFNGGEGGKLRYGFVMPRY